MDLFLLIGTCIVNLGLGTIIMVRDTSKMHARLFLLMSIVISLWIISNYFTNHFFGNYLLIDIANRLTFFTGYGIVVSGLLFTYWFPVKRDPSSKEKLFLTVLICSTFLISLSSLVAGGVVVTQDIVSFTNGPLVLLYLLSFLTLVAFIAKNLIKLPKKVSFKVKQQALLILMAFVLSALSGLTLNLVIPLLASGWQVTRLGPLSTVFLVVLVAYTIVKHGLFDIRSAIIRTATYVFSVLTVGVLYSLIFIVGLTNVLGFANLTYKQQFVLLMIAFGIGITFPLIVRFFDKFTSRIFFRGVYDFQDTVNEMTYIFSEANTLRQLLIKSSNKLRDILGAEFVTITLTKSEPTSKQHLAHTTSNVQNRFSLPTKTMELMEIKSWKIVSTDELSGDEGVSEELQISRASVVIQLNSSSAVLGYVIIGHKQNGTAFLGRDIDLLDTLSDEFAIAIQNMLRFEEITEFNSLLQQRINDATKELQHTNKKLHEIDKSKDEFISMASHQLRTPLTSVKGYISMVLEGDMGKISTQQREVLEQAYDSSQRMVFLIGDFLNVSRIQTGKFELEKSTINFTHLVDEEVEQLKETARMHEMTLVYDKPETEHVAVGDENKLRQVMMNFIDNAIFYSPKGSTITVRLYREASGLVFKVIDQGIGVPKEAQSKLFTKFFRASNARQQRPDGTGIGLYMAKKVIIAHEGTIIFETKEGVGSTFGFKLPLKKDLEQASDQKGAASDHSSRNSS